MQPRLSCTNDVPNRWVLGMTRLQTFSVGDTVETQLNGVCVVMEVVSSKRLKVRFVETGYETWTASKELRLGKVKDPLVKTLYGVGYMGDGPHRAKVAGVYNRAYYLWKNMMSRCYNVSIHIKQPTYTNCYVCEGWHNFQNFAGWYQLNQVEGFELDKDILTNGCGVCYSPETCCFIPKALNLLIQYRQDKDSGLPLGVDFSKNNNKYRARVCDGTNSLYLGYFSSPEEAFVVYKQAKERIIKEKAEEYREVIPERLYETLMKFEINEYHQSEKVGK